MIKQQNIKQFKNDFPQFKNLQTDRILVIFKEYCINIERTFDPQNITILVCGTLIILISKLYMNGGAGQEIVYFEKLKNSPNEIVMNTVITSATSGLTMVAMNQYKNIVKNETVREQTGMIQQNNVFSLCCSIVSGLVSITACCNSVSPLSSAFIGFFGCIIYQQTKWLLRRYEIDDPLDVTQTHGICGVWALIAVGIFDDKRGLLFTHKLDFIGI